MTKSAAAREGVAQAPRLCIFPFAEAVGIDQTWRENFLPHRTDRTCAYALITSDHSGFRAADGGYATQSHIYAKLQFHEMPRADEFEFAGYSA